VLVVGTTGATPVAGVPAVFKVQLLVSSMKTINMTCLAILLVNGAPFPPLGRLVRPILIILLHYNLFHIDAFVLHLSRFTGLDLPFSL
jgi:hypothetical protein